MKIDDRLTELSPQACVPGMTHDVGPFLVLYRLTQPKHLHHFSERLWQVQQRSIEAKYRRIIPLSSFSVLNVVDKITPHGWPSNGLLKLMFAVASVRRVLYGVQWNSLAHVDMICYPL